MSKVLFFFAMLIFLFTPSAWSADISGTWTVTMKNAQNKEESFDLIIKADGENLTVTTSSHPALKNLVGSGTLKGDNVAISVKTIDEHNIEFIFTGTVAGDKMKGTRELKLGAPPAGRTPMPAYKGEISNAFTAEKK